MISKDILGEIPILETEDNHGFVRYVDHMGTDSSIVQAARVSYGSGTKQVNEDEGLIRYLLRHLHTTPFEMCVLKIHVKIPIFVCRQSIRHRTFSVNEYSGRYSVMSKECYSPNLENIKPQSTTNKQGRSGELSDLNKFGAKWFIDCANKHSIECYDLLLGNADIPDERYDLIYDPYQSDDPLFDEDFKNNGIARELARTVLPVSNYTQLYMCGNLWNWMNFVRLRSDSHAQYEIQEMSNAVRTILDELFPLAMKAFDDYIYYSERYSRMENKLLTDLLKRKLSLMDLQDGKASILKEYGLTNRELVEFKQKIGL